MLLGKSRRPSLVAGRHGLDDDIRVRFGWCEKRVGTSEVVVSLELRALGCRQYKRDAGCPKDAKFQGVGRLGRFGRMGGLPVTLDEGHY